MLRRSQDPPERASGCIDTPFIGGDVHATTSGLSCGRERSPEAALLRGRVVSEELGGLPGAGLEGLWVTLHASDAGGGPLQLDALPPARAEQQTGPGGSFSIARTGAHGQEYVLAVRLEPDSPPLAARRVDGPIGTAELVVTVPMN
jgi:hypothetical protein